MNREVRVEWLEERLFLTSSPVAVGDAIFTSEDEVFQLDAPGILANDTDADGDALVVFDHDQVSELGAIVSLSADGGLVYDPTGAMEIQSLPQDGSAVDHFTYDITDGNGGTDTATVSVFLTGRNDTPTAVDDMLSVLQGSRVTSPGPGLLANDMDPDRTTPTGATGFFVAATGHSGGDGSQQAPWDLQTALSHPSAVQPGDTIWMTAGTYVGGFISNLNGTAAAPITVAALPGQHVVVDTYDGLPNTDRTFRVRGDYSHFRGIEFTSSDPTSRYSPTPGSHPAEIRRGSIEIYGDHTKFINVIVHDLSKGFGFWASGSGGEIYGSIVYNNGWLGPDRGHGPGIYTQNKFDTKKIVDTLVFNQYSTGLQAYGSSAASLTGLHLEGNASFNNTRWDILVGGGMVADDITVKNNFTYNNREEVFVDFGYSSSNQGISVTDNYFASTVRVRRAWDEITFTGNTIWGGDETAVQVIDLPPGVSASAYVWDGNRYQSADHDPFHFLNTSRTFEQWQQVTGWDANGQMSTASPTGVEVHVRPNQYEPGRGHVTVYNWDELPEVEVDLSTVVPVGAGYEIHHAYDLFGPPLVSGSFTGQSVTIPMAPIQSPIPISHTSAERVTLGPEFGVFVVTAASSPAQADQLTVVDFDSTSQLGAAVDVSPDGAFTYDPAGVSAIEALGATDIASDSFRYRIVDTLGETDEATVHVTVQGLNDAPIAVDDAFVTDSTSVLNVASGGLLANDSDIDVGDSLMVLDADAPFASEKGATVTLRSDGAFEYDPSTSSEIGVLASGASLQDSFVYRIDDGNGGVDTGTVTIRVNDADGDPARFPMNVTGSGQLRVVLDESGQVVQVFDDGLLLAARQLSLVSSLSITGAAHESDSLVVDFSRGNPIPYGDLMWDGSGGLATDRLVFEGRSLDSAAYWQSGENSGTIELSQAGVVSQVDFVGVESIASRLEVPAVSFVLADQDSSITLDNDGLNDTKLVSAALETIFRNPANSLSVSGGADVDSISVGGSASFSFSGSELALSADEVVVNRTTDTYGGNLLVNAGSFISKNGAELRTQGGSIEILSQVANIGEDVLTSGGSFHASGSGTFRAADAGAIVNTAGGDLSIGFDQGVSLQRIITAGGNVLAESQGDLVLLGILDARGSGPGDVTLRAENVNVFKNVLLGGGTLFTGGQSFTTENSVELRTGGGHVFFNSTNVLLGEDLITDGGNVSSVGDGVFRGFDAGAIIRTNGINASGNVVIDHGGDVTLFAITTGGGEIRVHSASQLLLKGKLNSQGNGEEHVSLHGSSIVVEKEISTGGGNFSSGGGNFENLNTARIRTLGGSLQMTHAGDVVIGEILDTDGGDLSSLQSGGVFLARDAGAILDTNGVSHDGNVTIVHSGDVTVFNVTADTGTVRLESSGQVAVRGNISAAEVIIVTGQNLPPIANDDSANGDEDSPLTVAAPGLLANDAKGNATDVLAVSEFDSVSVLGATLNVAPDGSYAYDPSGVAAFQSLPGGTNAIDSFGYTLSDGNGGFDTATVTVTVAGLNDDPAAANDAGDADEDVVLHVNENSLLANDTDVDGDDLQVIGFDDVSQRGAVVQVAPDGLYSYDPTVSAELQSLGEGETVLDQFQYTVSDGNGGVKSATVSITVTGHDEAAPGNRPPVAVDDNLTAVEDQVLASSAPGLLTNDSDPDAGSTILVIAFDAHSSLGASVSVSPEGSYVYDTSSAAAIQALAAGASVTDEFGYTIEDNEGATDTATVRVQVSGVNDPPIAVADVNTASTNTLLSVAAPGLLANDSDVDAGDELTVASFDQTSARGAVVDVATDGGFVYDPRASASLQALAVGQAVVDTFHYTVTDGQSVRSAEVSVTVTGASSDLLPLVFASEGELRLSLDTSGELIQLFHNGTLVDSRLWTQTSTVQVSGSANSADIFILDLGNGNPLPAGGGSVDGVAGVSGDHLVVLRGDVDAVTISRDLPGSGAIQFSDGSQSSLLAFSNIQPISSTVVVADLTLELSDADDAVSLRTAGSLSLLTGSDFGNTSFLTPRELLRITGKGGMDSVAVGVSSVFATGGASLELDAETISLDKSLLTKGGDFRASGVSYLGANGAEIRTSGGEIEFLFTGDVQIGEDVVTDGGRFRSTGSSGYFVSKDAGAIINTSGASTAGAVELDHQAGVTLYGVTTGGENLRIVSAGDAILKGRLDTTGQAAGHIDVAGNLVSVEEDIYVGGKFLGVGQDFVTNNGVELRTTGGDVVLTFDRNVRIGEDVATQGGSFRSTGSGGTFVAADAGAVIDTRGPAGGGAVQIEAAGGVVLQPVYNGGDALQFDTAGSLLLAGKISSNGGQGGLAMHAHDVVVQADITLDGGAFSSIGHSFTTDNGVDIRTFGGEVVLVHQGEVTLRETVQTGGGDFTSTGAGGLLAVDSGAYIDTSGGNALIDHVGIVVLNGGLKLGSGLLDLTLHLHSPSSQPLFHVRGSLPLPTGSLVTIDMDAMPIADVLGGPLPGVVEDIISYDTPSSFSPTVQVIDLAIGDAAFTAELSDDLDGTLDLIVS